MNEKNLEVKSTKLGAKIWVSIVLFGIIGQIAWVVENMYFATFAQNVFDGAEFGNAYYIATTLMVVFSALTSTLTTILLGGLIDKMGKRKIFITLGFILWGVTIMIFAAIPLHFGVDQTATIMSLLVIFDCIMTFFGSTAYDAAFNTWITDITDVTNRGMVDSALSLAPLIATAITVVLAAFTFNKSFEGTLEEIEANKHMYQIFFIVLGILPIIAGIASIWLIKDSPDIKKETDKNYWKTTFYGFKPSVIKDNKMMYVTLTALCLLGISQQVYMSYLMNFIIKTMGLESNVAMGALEVPLWLFVLAGLGVIAAIITALFGVFSDKYGRTHFYLPMLLVNILSMFIIFAVKGVKEAYIPTAIVVGGVMMGTNLALFAALMAAFQDYIPYGNEGRFQGVRMCFTVLIPMIIGPLISLIIGIDSFDPNATEALKPPFEIFLAAAIVAIIAIIPMIFIIKDSNRLRNTLLSKDDSVPEKIN